MSGATFVIAILCTRLLQLTGLQKVGLRNLDDNKQRLNIHHPDNTLSNNNSRLVC